MVSLCSTLYTCTPYNTLVLWMEITLIEVGSTEQCGSRLGPKAPAAYWRIIIGWGVGEGGWGGGSMLPETIETLDALWCTLNSGTPKQCS